MRAKRHDVEFTARKRDEDGERRKWTHGPFTEEEAIAWAAKMRARTEIRRFASVAIVPPILHADATRVGMARARSSGIHVGRPPAALNLERARIILADWTQARGRTEALRIAAGMLRVSVSTLERRFPATSKGAGGNEGGKS